MWTLIGSAAVPYGLWAQSQSAVSSQTPATLSTAPAVAPIIAATAPANEVKPGEVAPKSVAPTVSALPAPNFSGNPLPNLPKVAGHSYSIRTIVGGKSQQQKLLVSLKGVSVGGVLRALKIKVGPLDRVSPPVITTAFNGMTIRVRRVTTPLQRRRVTIAPQTRYQPTAAIAPGSRQIVQKGRAGSVEITERAWFLDGKQTLRIFVSRRVVTRPLDTIVALGSRRAYVPSRIPYHNRYARAYSLSGARGGGPRDRMTAPAPKAGTFRAVRSIQLVATGYSPDPRENGGYTTTATGLPIGYGAAAVDPRVIPLGTKLYVEGYGYAFACDTGGAIKGRRIDLAYDSYYLANTKGRKTVKVWILAP